MKKLVFSFLAFLIGFSLILLPGSYASEATSSSTANSNVKAVSTSQTQGTYTQFHMGLDTILLGSITRKSNGVPDHLWGLNAALGLGYRKYFGSNNQLRGWHPYWEIGTWLVILPYAGIGTEYSIPLGGDETGKKGVFSIGLGAYLYTIIPAPALTFSVSF